MKPATAVSIPEKLASGSFLHIRKEFAPWIGVSVARLYEEVKLGRLKTTKIGHRTFVSAADARAYRDLIIASQPSDAGPPSSAPDARSKRGRPRRERIAASSLADPEGV